ncbi:MAG TPA: glutamate--tRNA ligase, partial [Oligoflexia bacterium]|nr:glutamate--tRNA ligase [Oligoflexia bacterium]
KLIARIGQAQLYGEAELETLFNDLIASEQIKMADLAQAVRVALTGTSVSPPIFLVLEVLGRESVVTRLRAALNMVR